MHRGLMTQDGPALEEVASLGTCAGVFQLLDRHNRECEATATRLGVPLLRLPDTAADTPLETDASNALDDALAHSRSDIPRLVASLPQLVRGGRARSSRGREAT